MTETKSTTDNVNDLIDEVSQSEASQAWIRGYNQGRSSYQRELEAKYFPSPEKLTSNAEFVYSKLLAKYGNIFDSLYCGFNPHYMEATMLVVLDDSNGDQLLEMRKYCVKLESEIVMANGFPLSVLVSRKKNVNFESVLTDHTFKRELGNANI